MPQFLLHLALAPLGREAPFFHEVFVGGFHICVAVARTGPSRFAHSPFEDIPAQRGPSGGRAVSAVLHTTDLPLPLEEI